MEAYGLRLILRRSANSFDALMSVLEETGARLVVLNDLYDAVSFPRDRHIHSKLEEQGVQLCSFQSDVLFMVRQAF